MTECFGPPYHPANQPCPHCPVRAGGRCTDFFRVAYEQTAPWDIGRPQATVVQMQADGFFFGSVLDVGCGTGDNALYIAQHGHAVTAIDFSPYAIGVAQAKARAHSTAIDFRLHDALKLGGLGRTFDTVLDAAFFHGLTLAERAPYLHGLSLALKPGGYARIVCFNEHELRPGGPRRIFASDIYAVFQSGWIVEHVIETRYYSRIDTAGARAWLASIRRS